MLRKGVAPQVRVRGFPISQFTAALGVHQGKASVEPAKKGAARLCYRQIYH